MVLTGYKGAIKSIAISINRPKMSRDLISKIKESSGAIKHFTFLNRINHKSDLQNLAIDLPTEAFLRKAQEEVKHVEDYFKEELGTEFTIGVIPYLKQEQIRINGDDSSVVGLPLIDVEACDEHGIMVVTLKSNAVWVQDLIMFVHNDHKAKPTLVSSPKLLESNVRSRIGTSIYTGLVDWFAQAVSNSSNLLAAFTCRDFAKQKAIDYLIEGGDIVHLDEFVIVGSRSVDFNNHLALHSKGLLKTIHDGLSAEIGKHVLFNATPFKFSRFWDQKEDKVFGVTQPLYHLDLFFQAFQYREGATNKLILLIANPRAADAQSTLMAKQASVLSRRVKVWTKRLIKQLEFYFGCIEVREIPLLVGPSIQRTVSFTNGILEVTSSEREKQAKIGNYYVANIDHKDDYWKLYKHEIYRAEVELIRALPELNIHFIYSDIDAQSLEAGGLHCNVKILEREH